MTLSVRKAFSRLPTEWPFIQACSICKVGQLDRYLQEGRKFRIRLVPPMSIDNEKVLTLLWYHVRVELYVGREVLPVATAASMFATPRMAHNLSIQCRTR